MQNYRDKQGKTFTNYEGVLFSVTWRDSKMDRRLFTKRIYSKSDKCEKNTERKIDNTTPYLNKLNLG